jgi:arylsulfatase A-like enzyme
MPLTRRALLTAPALVRAQAKRRPNVLLIMADDFGYECVGANGGVSYATPNLDRFAQSGIRFTHAYAQPLCTPTRIQLMTGQHNFRNYQSFGTMRPDEKTFGHMMQRAGYRTVIAGKWQLFSYDVAGSKYRGTGKRPEQGGFDEFLLWHDAQSEDKGSRYADPVLNENGKLRADTKGKYGPDLFTDYLSRFFSRQKDQPFFAYYPMALTHGPFNLTPHSQAWPTGNRLKDDPRNFADMVAYLDYDFNRLMQGLEKSSQAENTLVLFYSDNGSPPEVVSKTKTRTIAGGKRLTTDAGMHVPLFARWPGFTKAGAVNNSLIDSTDFVPTLAEATGAGWFPGLPLDGRSFLPQIRGERGNPKDHLFSHFDPHPSCKADVPPTRLVWNHTHKLYLDGRYYNWAQDPEEKSAVAPESNHAALKSKLDAMNAKYPPVFRKFEPDGKPAY